MDQLVLSEDRVANQEDNNCCQGNIAEEQC